MEIKIEDPSQILSHTLLGDTDLSTAVARTKEWEELGAIKGELTFNGVSVSAQRLEDTIKDLIDQVEEYYSEKYNADNIDNLVEEKAKELLKEHADNVLEKMQEFMHVLGDSSDIIKPHWESK